MAAPTCPSCSIRAIFAELREVEQKEANPLPALAKARRLR